MAEDDFDTANDASNNLSDQQLQNEGEPPKQSKDDWADPFKGKGSKSYSVRIGRVGGGLRGSGLESAIRSLAIVNTRLPDPPRPAPPPLPGEDGEASITWGAASDFQTDVPEQPAEDATADGDAPAGQTQQKEETKPQDKKPGVVSYNEIDRRTEKGKIYNPDDKEQWVEVTRIKSMRLRGPKKEILKLNFKNPPWPKEPE